MGVDARDPDPLDIGDGGGERDHAFDMRGAGLEPRRGGREARAGKAHPVDHRAAALPGGHRRQNLVARPQHADAGRAIKLVPRQHIEIAVERRHVEREARCRLTAVEQQLRADAAGKRGGAADIEHAAKHVRHMRKGDQPVPFGQHRRGGIKVDPAIGGQRADIDADAGVLLDQLPGHDVRMMLERRQQDAVAGLQIGAAPALRDQIDPLGRAAGEHDLVRPGPNEAGDGGARRLERQRHVGRAAIDAAMHGRIIARITVGDGVDHRLRLLRRRRRVEIGPAFGQCREIGTMPGDHRIGGGVEHRAHARAPSHSAASASSAARTASSATGSSASATKARVRIARASAGGSPRLAR